MSFAEFCYTHNIHSEIFWWEHFTKVARILESETDIELKKEALIQFLTFKVNAPGINIPLTKQFAEMTEELRDIKLLKFAWPYVN